jgi:hypothetical protein
MRILYFLIVLIAFTIENVKGSESFICSAFTDPNHGFGCVIKNVKPDDEIIDVSVKRKDSSKYVFDINWVGIYDSDLPNRIANSALEKNFMNLKRIEIVNCTGFKMLNGSIIDKNPGRFSELIISTTDIGKIDENTFSELIQLVILVVNSSKIEKIHKDALEDLINLEEIYLNDNFLKFLYPDTFKHNMKLKLINLENNKLRRISSDLFPQNTNIENIFLGNNNITQIERGSFDGLKNLKILNLTSNLCIDKCFTLSNYHGYTISNKNSYLDDCIKNFRYGQFIFSDIKEIEENINLIENKFRESMKKLKEDEIEQLKNDLSSKLMTIYFFFAFVLICLIGMSVSFFFMKKLQNQKSNNPMEVFFACKQQNHQIT